MPENEPNLGGGAPPVPPPATVWHTGKVDAETVGLWTNKGYDVNDPVAVATGLTKAYNEAQKFVGAPANELLRIPKPEDEAGRRAMWQRLGAPDTPEGYDFAAIKFADGTGLDQGFVDIMRQTAASYGLTKDAASAVAQNVVKFMEGQEAAESADSTAAMALAKQALAKDWGPNYDRNLFIAKSAANALGVTPEQVAALESQIGYTQVMQMFHTIGIKTGEARYVDGGNTGGNAVLTAGQAQARVAELKSDAAWVKRYMDGGKAEANELKSLLIIQHGDDTDWSRGR